MVLPPEKAVAIGAAEDARQFFKRPDTTEAQWATNCFFAFRHALGGEE
jgi:hypothetical protein